MQILRGFIEPVASAVLIVVFMKIEVLFCDTTSRDLAYSYRHLDIFYCLFLQSLRTMLIPLRTNCISYYLQFHVVLCSKYWPAC